MCGLTMSQFQPESLPHLHKSGRETHVFFFESDTASWKYLNHPINRMFLRGKHPFLGEEHANLLLICTSEGVIQAGIGPAEVGLIGD